MLRFLSESLEVSVTEVVWTARFELIQTTFTMDSILMGVSVKVGSYLVDLWETLQFSMLTCSLYLSKQYPEAILDLQYHEDFAVRGLHYDMRKVSLSVT